MRATLFRAAFYLATALILLLGSPLLLAPRSLAMAGLRFHGRTVLWLLRNLMGIGIEVRGREHLPKGAALVAAKHQSSWETFVLPVLLPDPALVMKAELMRIPLYGWFSAKFGMIGIEREKGPAALRRMLKAARDRAAEGRQVLIFPEGTRKAPGSAPDYKPGVVALYDALQVPCVPVALNSGLLWPGRRWPERGGTILIELLPAIPPGLPRREFLARLQSEIEAATGRLLAEGGGAPAAETCGLQAHSG
jgi:1-acyl-sn-glycerol-3-phosphate acyltransferase